MARGLPHFQTVSPNTVAVGHPATGGPQRVLAVLPAPVPGGRTLFAGAFRARGLPSLDRRRGTTQRRLRPTSCRLPILRSSRFFRPGRLLRAAASTSTTGGHAHAHHLFFLDYTVLTCTLTTRRGSSNRQCVRPGTDGSTIGAIGRALTEHPGTQPKPYHAPRCAPLLRCIDHVCSTIGDAFYANGTTYAEAHGP